MDGIITDISAYDISRYIRPCLTTAHIISNVGRKKCEGQLFSGKCFETSNLDFIMTGQAYRLNYK